MAPLISIVAAVTLQSLALQQLQGPFVSLEAACGESRIKSRTETSGFCTRMGVWQVALRDGDEWFVGPLPLQEGITPKRVEGPPPLYRVHFVQRSFSPDGVDQDGQWVWPCVGGACIDEPIPMEVQDRSSGVEADVSADLLMSPEIDGKWQLHVIFTKVRITGRSARAGDWRALIGKLRGHHVLELP